MSYSVVEGDLEPDMLLTVTTATQRDLADAVSVELRWKKPDGVVDLVALVEVTTSVNSGVYKRVWEIGDTDMTGVHRGQVVITWDVGATEEVETCPNDGSWTIWHVYSAA